MFLDNVVRREMGVMVVKCINFNCIWKGIFK